LNKQSLNLLAGQRVDVTQLRLIESAGIFDFQSLLQIMQGTTPYILNGFTIPTSTTINNAATSTQVVVSNASIWMPTDENGAFLLVPAGTANEVLSPSNPNVVGSFAAGQTNYLGIQFVRAPDPTTADLVQIWDVDAQSEFSQTVPLGLVLNYQFVISTTGFGTTAPVAIIQTSSSNNVISVENCKQSLFRLGTGGANPNPFNNEVLTPAVENPLIATSVSSPDPFAGGDWEIQTLKEWMDFVMTRFKDLTGSAYWYIGGSSISGLNLLDLYNDAVGSVMVGNGTFTHSSVTAGLLSWTSDLLVKSIMSPRYYRFLAGSVTLNDEDVLYAVLDRNDFFLPAATFQFTSGTNTVISSIPVTNLLVGDWIKAYQDDENDWIQVTNITGSTITLASNYPNTWAAAEAVKSVGTYSLTPTAGQGTLASGAPDTVPANADVYWIAKRSDLAITPVAITSIARVTDIITLTLPTGHGIVAGQAITISGVTADTSANGEFYALTATTNTVTYESEGANFSASGQGTVSSTPMIYLRELGRLDMGDVKNVDGTIPETLLAYIGSPDESVASPYYGDSPTGSLGLTDYSTVAGENLTTRLSKVTALLADAKQNFDIDIDPGSVGWDGTTISIVGAQLSIPGTTVGAAPVPINTYSAALPANNAVYVSFSRTSDTALTLATGTLASLTPAQQTLIVARNVGGDILL
jgi:hypothetical protein